MSPPAASRFLECYICLYLRTKQKIQIRAAKILDSDNSLFCCLKALKKSDDSDDEEVIVRPKRWKAGWWLDFVDPSELESAQGSPKVTVLFEIIQQCEKNHEKL